MCHLALKPFHRRLRNPREGTKMCCENNFEQYENALEELMLAKLSDRREKLCLKLAKNFSKNPFTSDLFPKNVSSAMQTRNRERYQVTRGNTDRLIDSAVLDYKSTKNYTKKHFHINPRYDFVSVKTNI